MRNRNTAYEGFFLKDEPNLSFPLSFAAGVGDAAAAAVAERLSGQVERLVAEEMRKVTAALNGISEHTVKIDEVCWILHLVFALPCGAPVAM